MKLPLSDDQRSWVERIFKSLSLCEKIGQTIQEQISPAQCADVETAKAFFSRYPYGSLFCGGEIIKSAGGTTESMRKRLQICQHASKLPLLVAGDLEHGAGAAIEDLTVFPKALALGAANDKKLAYDYGRFTALEGRLAGFNWTFYPVVDLLDNWLNPIVSHRALGEAPARVSSLAGGIIRGLQEHGMAACAKHFPGDGVDFKDQHLTTSVNSLPEQRWRERHGAVFQSVIDAGVYTIMAGHIALPWRESSPTERPRPATVSPDVLTGLLRHEMEFEGVIVSDALNMAGYTGWARREQRLLEAFNAGVDVMLWPGGQSYFDMMERALEAGTVSMQRLDESVLRILELKARLGLHLPSRDESPSPVQRETIHAGAVKLANAVAEKSITLVRNRSGLLPLDQAKIKRVLVHFSIPESVPANRRDHLEIFVTSLKARGLEVTVLENGNCMDIKNREEAGETWDAYLVIYSLMGHQLKNTLRPTGEMAEVMWTQQNVETLQPITISLCTPYLLYDLPYLDTLVNTYSASPSSMRALDRALFGEINFCEHPPVSAEQEIGTWR